MRRSCIAIGQVESDGCHRELEYGERYLVIDGEGGEKQRLCVDCCLKLGYASYKEERGEETITFSTED